MKYLLLIICWLGLSLIPAGAAAGAADISGTWTFTINKVMSPGTVDVTFVIKQEGEKLSGAYSGPTGEYPITGTVKGDKVVISYGHFLQVFLNFLVIAGSIFLMFKLISSVRARIAKKEQENPETKPEPTEEQKLLMEIRDSLKQHLDSHHS